MAELGGDGDVCHVDSHLAQRHLQLSKLGHREQPVCIEGDEQHTASYKSKGVGQRPAVFCQIEVFDGPR